MKISKYIYLFVFSICFTLSCDLEEEPPYLANENVFSSASDAVKALDGIYASMNGYDYYANMYHFLFNVSSGLGWTKRGQTGAAPSPDNLAEGSLNFGASRNIERVWIQVYRAIGRANDAISSITVDPLSEDDNQRILNDVAGQAYFLRAHMYFNLVRAWGEVPLRVQPTSMSSIHLAVSSEEDIYTQILSDVNSAIALMNASSGNHYPKVYAAYMLLSKIHMQLAGNDNSSEHWQKAYDAAKMVYDEGGYALVPNYADLFDESSDLEIGNEIESIFEIQSSNLSQHPVSTDFVRAFTASNYLAVQTFGWLMVNVDTYESHNMTYPGDSRMDVTYISEFIKKRAGAGNPWKGYPARTNRSKWNAFPYFHKFAQKDQESAVLYGNQNFIVYRYADLLLMLAEISNELGLAGEALDYATQVLSRSNLTPHSGYTSGQDAFRDAIMREYKYELLFEGEDWFNNRRRGLQWFLDKTVIPHNTGIDDQGNVLYTFKNGIDNEMRTDASIMKFPIPLAEINNNQEIN